jgi:hypothetical protein
MSYDKKATIKVNYDGFVQFYFYASDYKSIWEDTIKNLIDNGEVTVQGCLEEAGYIPLNIVENPEDVDEDDIRENPPEIDVPGDVYNLELVRN